MFDHFQFFVGLYKTQFFCLFDQNLFVNNRSWFDRNQCLNRSFLKLFDIFKNSIKITKFNWIIWRLLWLLILTKHSHRVQELAIAFAVCNFFIIKSRKIRIEWLLRRSNKIVSMHILKILLILFYGRQELVHIFIHIIISFRIQVFLLILLL